MSCLCLGEGSGKTATHAICLLTLVSHPSAAGHCHGWDDGQVRPVIRHGIVVLTFSALCSTALYLHMLDLYLLTFGGQPHLPA